ncbi:MAG: hypothetical protein ACKO13_00940, partial [Cytophagales bacterium]
MVLLASAHMSPTKRIAVILTFVFLLPALFFSVYEISSLSKDEKMIEQIYQKQLEAILFSVNQISDATVNSWMSKVSISQNEEVGESAISPSLNTLLTLNPAIQAAFMVDSTHEKATIQLYTLDTARSAKSK